MNQKCYFCGEDKFSLNKKVGLPCEDSIIYQDENVFVIPDIAPLLKGHFLIVTREHLLSLAQSDDLINESVQNAKNFLIQNVFNKDNILFFEHGSVSCFSNCVDHAHMHALPSPLNVDNIENFIKASGFIESQRQIGNRAVLSDFFDEGQPYLYYELGTEKWAYPADNIPSQFFRQMIAFELKSKIHHNWRISYKNESSKQIFIETLDMGLEKKLVALN